MSKPGKIDLLKCKFWGHDFIEGPRYRNASISGGSKICQRCGFYEIVLDGEDGAAPKAESEDKQTQHKRRIVWEDSRW